MDFSTEDMESQDPWAETHQQPHHHRDDDVTTSQPIQSEARQSRGRSRERRRKGLNSAQEMATPSPRPSSHSPGRGRTPSPKRSPAPAPPNPLRCPSPAPKAVSTCDVLPSDQQGWLIDQLRGRKVWCAVADMLFCVFEKPDSKVSKQVLLLPGCKVRQVEFKTASKDNRLVNGINRKYRSKTISGVDKFQFWIENGSNRQRFMFGVDTKETLEQWMEVLTRVASVDTDSLAPDSAPGDSEQSDDGPSESSSSRQGRPSDPDGSTTATGRSQSASRIPRGVGGSGGRGADETRRRRSGSSGGGGRSEGGGIGPTATPGCAYTPSQTLPRRIDFLSLSLGNAQDVRKDSVDDIRKRLRREHEHTQDHKTTPLKATYDDTDPAASRTTSTTATSSSSPSTTAATSATRRRSFFKVGGFESLFSRSKKRSASADDAGRRTMKNVKKTQRSSSSSTTGSPESPRKYTGRKLSRAGSEDLSKEGAADAKPEGTSFLSRSWDGQKNAEGLGASIRRSASDIKSRFFSTSGKSRGPGLKLGDLRDSRLQGFLQYKGTVRWIKIWGVLCRGCFYGFRSDKSNETPLLVFVLPQCTVSYVADSDTTSSTTKKHKKQFSFKLSQAHCRSLSLGADNHRELMRWLLALQQEACKVVADDDVSSVETEDNSSNASSDVATPRMMTSSSVSSSPRSGSSLTKGSGSKWDGVRSRAGSEASNYSNVSSESGVGSGYASSLPSSSQMTLTNTTTENQDVKNSGSRIPRPHSMASFSSSKSSNRKEETDRFQTDQSEEAGGREEGGLLLHPDQTGVSSLSQKGDDADSLSSISQPNTPRHDDALTQVWSKDKGYLLQLIRTKLLRRKKRGDSLAEGGNIYNKELSSSHEGGLLIHQDDEEMVEICPEEGSYQEALLNEVRHRSKSFTEGKPTADHKDTLPPDHLHLPSTHPAWTSSPATSRDLQLEDSGDVISPEHRPLRARQRDVRESYDDVGKSDDVVTPRGSCAGSVVRHPRQRIVSDDDTSGSRETTRRAGDVADVTADVNRDFVRSGDDYVFVRGDDVVNDDNGCDDGRDGRKLSSHHGGSTVAAEKRIHVTTEHSRTYSAAWDEYDSEEESNQFDHNLLSNDHNSSNNIDNDHNDSLQDTTKFSDRDKDRNSGSDGTWVTSGPETGTHIIDAAASRSNTIPRHRPPTLFSTHTALFGSKPDVKTVDPREEEQLTRFSSSETLGRQPRGPILRYLQRTRCESSSPSASPKAFSLDGPIENKFVFPGEHPSGSSAEAEQDSKEAPLFEQNRGSNSTKSSVEQIRNSSSASPGTSKNISPASEPQRPSHPPATAASRKSSTKGIPQPSKKSSSIPQRARSASQGPPQSERKSTSGIPISSSSKTSSNTPGPVPSSRGGTPTSGIPVRPRSASTGPNYSTRQPLEKAPDSSRIPRAGGKVKAEPSGGRRRPHSTGVMELAAKDLQSPALHGFLCRRTLNDQWIRYWYVLQDESLYCYLTPDDHVTVDVTDLDGYSVTSLEDKFPGQRFVLHLEHKDYIPVYLSTSSREEMEEWNASLTSAIKVIPRVNGLHLPEQQEEAEGARAPQAGEDRVLGIKQKLLAEVLRQTQELERKQAARQATKHKQLSLDEYEAHSPPSTPPPPSITPTGEQICTLTRLRQRRMSTQIKMDTLQRQMQTNGHAKKSRFTFGKKKSTEETVTPQNPDIVQQLKTLSDHLSAIDRDLLQNGGIVDRKTSSLPSSTASRGRKMMSRHSQDLEGSSMEGVGKKSSIRSVDGVMSEESAINRSNSLKSSVQKLAHRTFGKAGWYRNKKSSQGDSLEREDTEDRSETPQQVLHHHNNNDDNTTNINNNNKTDDSPDVIDLSHRLMRTWPAREASQDSEEGGLGGDLSGEVFLPPPSSFFDGGVENSPSSPVSSPRSVRSAGSAGSASVGEDGRGGGVGSGGERGRRSGSSVGEESRIPVRRRRQLDPDAMANIEAFEEMSRQILGEPT